MKCSKLMLTLIMAVMIVLMLLPVSAHASFSSTSWDDVDDDSFVVTTTKKNATVTVQVRKVKSFTGLYPMSSIGVRFNPDAGAKAVTVRTGSYILFPSDGLRSFRLTFDQPGTYSVDVMLASGMDAFLSGGDVEWRIVSTKNAIVE